MKPRNNDGEGPAACIASAHKYVHKQRQAGCTEEEPASWRFTAVKVVRTALLPCCKYSTLESVGRAVLLVKLKLCLHLD